LQTSILDSLSAPLCEAVTGHTPAQLLIEQLKEANLFLIPLDHRQEWYRYHALFADLLRKRLYQTRGGEVSGLHSRASHWYQENGMLAQAVEHALAAQDFRWAAELIVQEGEALLKRNETTTLLRWLEALPLQQKQDHPILFADHALALMLSGKPPGPVKAHLEEIATAGTREDIQGEIAAVRALYVMMEGNPTEAIRLSQQALEQLPHEQLYFRSLAADGLGMAYTLRGDTAAATKAFEQVVDLTSQSGDMIMTINALSNLAGMRYMMGQLRGAAASYQQVLDLAAARLGERSSATGKALLGLGELAREWNDLEGALKYYHDAASVLEKSVEIGLAIVLLSIARVKATQGDWDSAQEYLERARLHAQGSTTTPSMIASGSLQVRFWIARGELELAGHWAQAHGLLEQPIGSAITQMDGNAALSEFVLSDHLTLARLLLAQGQPEWALEALNPLLDVFERKAHMRRMIEVLVLKALACKQQGEIEAALLSLDRAVALARPEGYQRTFLDEGEPMAQLLYQAIARGDSSSYTKNLLAALSDELSRPLAGIEQVLAESLVEPLSERELEVLNLIADGLSNREISARLYISPSTVKGHTANIYGKLNVSSRTQAVARAHSLGILLPRQ
jgi:LuxR family maltose regulon positive regulatory protein